jgi:hypothetical protein
MCLMMYAALRLLHDLHITDLINQGMLRGTETSKYLGKSARMRRPHTGYPVLQ